MVALVRMVWTEDDVTDPRHRKGLPLPAQGLESRLEALRAEENFARVLDLQGNPVQDGASELPPPDPELVRSMLAIHGDEHRHAVYAVNHGDRRWMVLLQPIRKDGSDVAVLQFGATWRQPHEVTRALVLFLIVGTLTASALCIGIAFALANWLSRPIRQLHESTVRFQGGDLKARTGVSDERSQNEVVQLSAAFDRMAENIEQSMVTQRRFIADASHELKTPLTAIGGMADMLRLTQEPEKQQKAINIIVRETDRMSRLVGDLLTLSKVEHAPTEPGLGRVSLDKVLRETAEVVAAANPKRTIEVQAQEGLHLFGNPDELARLVRNLLDNAVQHTPPGTSIQASCRALPDGILLEVADQGPGISRADLPHLFDRFYRPDASRARKTGGSGLGLAIVKSIATRHGGRVQVLSELGKGSVFQVVFRSQS